MDRITRFLLPTIYIVAIASLRLLPHTPNLVPMTAICLFAGAQRINWPWRFATPLVAVAMTDVLQGTNLSLITACTYIGYALIVCVGRYLESSKKVSRLLPTSVIGSFAFFIVSNLGFWIFTPFYPHTITGLVTCYIRGLPFLLNSMVADAFYVVFMFVGYALLKEGGGARSQQWFSTWFHDTSVRV